MRLLSLVTFATVVSSVLAEASGDFAGKLAVCRTDRSACLQICKDEPAACAKVVFSPVANYAQEHYLQHIKKNTYNHAINVLGKSKKSAEMLAYYASKKAKENIAKNTATFFSSVPIWYAFDWVLTYQDTGDFTYTTFKTGCVFMAGSAATLACAPFSGPLALGCGVVSSFLAQYPCEMLGKATSQWVGDWNDPDFAKDTKAKEEILKTFTRSSKIQCGPDGCEDVARKWWF